MIFNLFKKKEKTLAAKVSQTDNPYLNARRTWNGHVSGVMSAIQIWQVVGILALLIALTAVGGIIKIGSQSKFVPLVFQQDSTGNTLSVTRADKIPDAKIEDYRTTAAKFIENIRLVTADSSLQRKAVLQTYSYLSAKDPSTIKANEYLNGSKDANPFNRATKELVSIDVKSVMLISDESWQVDWEETLRGRDGTLKGKPYMMRAIVNLYQNQPTDDNAEVEVLRNPHFIFVRDFNWSKPL
ncbi:TPA: conjugal transfer protein TrbF [Yersinia enterocolitica]|uniref:conjugal transfer protein TrbF n=1 Tax=Yersinia enterocolitica TaxID=630 RepID=UPI0029A36057|nr:conjugal transfer protein TrbF [Yersinia enterocolitica]EKN5104259.1 conjugal transfer protein TrbF [Yersinia enterocolitica]EKN6091029.1 conjugal transfer protein TrbF [Yersinia enterocolitica]ELX2238787.1 conjugal transfer protein TrbF [Yersinia enterocolitica]ELY5241992.1 conjugal transfer protein TrbF [Yersinia enterocolitica]